MSIAEIERFDADIRSNAALRAEIETSAKPSQATPFEDVVAFAAAKGYGFTASELMEHAKTKAAASGSVVSDAELEGVSAGNGFQWVFGGLFLAAMQMHWNSKTPSSQS